MGCIARSRQLGQDRSRCSWTIRAPRCSPPGPTRSPRSAGMWTCSPQPATILPGRELLGRAAQLSGRALAGGSGQLPAVQRRPARGDRLPPRLRRAAAGDRPRHRLRTLRRRRSFLHPRARGCGSRAASRRATTSTTSMRTRSRASPAARSRARSRTRSPAALVGLYPDAGDNVGAAPGTDGVWAGDWTENFIKNEAHRACTGRATPPGAPSGVGVWGGQKSRLVGLFYEWRALAGSSTSHLDGAHRRPAERGLLAAGAQPARGPHRLADAGHRGHGRLPAHPVLDPSRRGSRHHRPLGGLLARRRRHRGLRPPRPCAPTRAASGTCAGALGGGPTPNSANVDAARSRGGRRLAGAAVDGGDERPVRAGPHRR